MIGLFDSGVGGLTVLKKFIHRAPGVSFVYLGDTARTPYGNKGANTIEKYAIENTRFLLERGATSIVIACNSVSAVALDALRKTYPEIPFFDVITPATELVAADTSIKKIGIIGTRATVGSGVYQDLIHQTRPDAQVVAAACPLLVPLAEEGWQGRPETQRIVRRYLKPMRDAQIDALILGCTHYPLLLKEIRSGVHKRVKIIDSPRAVYEKIAASHPELFSQKENPSQQFFFTDCSEHTARIAQTWIGRGIRCELAELEF